MMHRTEGNQECFQTATVKSAMNGAQCKVISLPIFATTATAVLLNTDTLEATPICFASADLA